MLAELSNCNIPFVSVPLPSSAENHQLKNALYYQRKNFAFLIEEKDLNDKLLYLIKEIYEDSSKLENLTKIKAFAKPLSQLISIWDSDPDFDCTTPK